MSGDTSQPSRTLFFMLLALIVVGGFLFRVWHLDFGLPARYHPDETVKYKVAEQILRGGNPRYFLHPGFLVNTVALSFKVGESVGRFDTERRLWWARVAVAILGCATIWCMGLLGRELYGGRAGIFSALALAVVPIHVLHSRYVKEDIHLVFSVVLALLMLVKWRQGDRRLVSWTFVGVLLGVGLCASSKFVGAAMLPFAMGVVIASMRSNASRALGVGAILTASLAIFLAFSHHVLHDPGIIWSGITREFSHGVNADWKPTLRFWQWPDLGFYFLVVAIAPGIGVPLTLAGLWGAWRVIANRAAERNAFMVLLCGVMWYVIAELTPLKRGTGIERYALPCAPVLILLAAGLTETLAERLHGRWRFAWVGVTTALLLLPLLHSAAVSNIIDRDTRRDARRWLNANVPSAVRIGYPSDLYMPDWAYRSNLVLCHINQPVEEFRRSLQTVHCFAMSSFFNGRYENFPTLSGEELEKFRIAREEFPHAVIFRRPWYQRMYFHQPTIEIRFRNPPPGMKRVDSVPDSGS